MIHIYWLLLHLDFGQPFEYALDFNTTISSF